VVGGWVWGVVGVGGAWWGGAGGGGGGGVGGVKVYSSS